MLVAVLVIVLVAVLVVAAIVAVPTLVGFALGGVMAGHCAADQNHRGDEQGPLKPYEVLNFKYKCKELYIIVKDQIITFIHATLGPGVNPNILELNCSRIYNSIFFNYTGIRFSTPRNILSK